MHLKNHITLTSATDVLQICKPLFEFLQANYFTFHRMYDDGSCIRLATNSEWTEYCLKKDIFYANGSDYEKESKVLHSSNLTKYFLWDHLPKEDSERVKLLSTANIDFNIAHGLIILKRKEKYVDLYMIATERNDEDINHRYFRYLDSIEKFNSYFLLKAENIITQAKKTGIFRPRSIITLDNPELNKEEYNFQKALEINGMPLCYNGEMTFLTKRETQCLLNLMRGKAPKEIAKIYQISPRTVETYINNIKSKTNCHARSQILKLAHECDWTDYYNILV